MGLKVVGYHLEGLFLSKNAKKCINIEYNL
jgi:hypothetical protein